MNHFTDRDGYNAISSQQVWLFVASQPPGRHPFGAFFTTLPPDSPNLAQRLRIPRLKLGFAFVFSGEEGLTPLPGGRGEYIFYSPISYPVEKDRQVACGEASL